MGFVNHNQQKNPKNQAQFLRKVDRKLDIFENIYLSTNQPLYNPFIIPSDPRPKIEPAPIQALIDQYSQKTFNIPILRYSAHVRREHGSGAKVPFLNDRQINKCSKQYPNIFAFYLFGLKFGLHPCMSMSIKDDITVISASPENAQQCNPHILFRLLTTYLYKMICFILNFGGLREVKKFLFN